MEDPHYTPAKEYIYHHDDPDVLELKVTSGFKDPSTGGYVEYVDLLDLSGKPLGDYRIVLETRKDVGQTGPTENLKFEVYISKRLQPVESVLRTKPISLGDAIEFSFTPQGTGLEDIVWSISRDNGQTWVEVQAGTLLPADGASEILLKADLKIVEGREPPVVTGIDWVFVAERETSERYTFTGKERDATGLYYFGARYYDPEIGRFVSEDPVGDGVIWYEYCNSSPTNCIDPDGQESIVPYKPKPTSITPYDHQPFMPMQLPDEQQILEYGINLIYNIIVNGKVSIIRINYEAGIVGEEWLAKLYGGQRRVSIGFDNFGKSYRRVIDVKVGGIAMESKVGRVHLTSRIKDEIFKDKFLLQNKGYGIYQIEWHFFRGKSGIGPEPEVRRLLEDAGIRIIIHDDVKLKINKSIWEKLLYGPM